jgi:1,2-diacylglycerol 3-beta-glucosyltransferase
LTNGDVIAVFDADARVRPDFLDCAMAYLRVSGVGAVQGQKRMSNVLKSSERRRLSLRDVVRRSFFLPLLQDVEMLMDAAYQAARGHGRGAVDLRGNGMLVWRGALQAVGGWNDDTLTDDLDLSTRLHAAGWQVAFCPKAVVWEEGVLSWRALFRQRARWVEGFIRRYLDHGEALLRAPVPAMMKIDAFLFGTEIILPMLMFFGLLTYLTCLALGLPYDPVITVAVALGNAAVTLPFILIVVWQRVTREPLRYALLVCSMSVYLLHWLPVIVGTVLRLAALRPQTGWAKTEHVGEPG